MNLIIENLLKVKATDHRKIQEETKRNLERLGYKVKLEKKIWIGREGKIDVFAKKGNRKKGTNIEFMKIIDKKNLIPDKNVLIKIAKEHPSGRNLYNDINTLTIELSTSNTENIYFDMNTKDATLCVFEGTALEDNFESILYHEFFHIADRLDPKFKYSDEKKDALTQVERRCVMELWNLYIDTRLNSKGLFVVWKGSSFLKIGGKIQICHNMTIDIRIRHSINFLKARGVNEAEQIVRKIWKNSDHYLSYNDMINIVKNSRDCNDQNN